MNVHVSEHVRGGACAGDGGGGVTYVFLLHKGLFKHVIHPPHRPHHDVAPPRVARQLGQRHEGPHFDLRPGLRVVQYVHHGVAHHTGPPRVSLEERRGQRRARGREVTEVLGDCTGPGSVDEGGEERLRVGRHGLGEVRL